MSIPESHSTTDSRPELVTGRLSDSDAFGLLGYSTAELMDWAANRRDAEHGARISYSRKVFIPLTQLCQDVCHYCTFAQTPSRLDAPYLTSEQVLEIARAGRAMGCKEALFTLGDKPELRYSAARSALKTFGYDTTLDYLLAMAKLVLDETGLLPHLNPGVMSEKDITKLRPASVSMGIMLESVSSDLLQRGGCHYGSPDKIPAVRLATIDAAGEQRVPFTSGILIGIGETRRSRIDSLLALRQLHDRHGHLQEIIVQNFRAKAGTLMVDAPEPDLAELQWSIAVARLIFPPEMNIQAPPNLSAGSTAALIEAGINDWGGISPVTPDHVNPEAPWPQIDDLATDTAKAGKTLVERLGIYPAYVGFQAQKEWLDVDLRKRVLDLTDADGLARTDDWCPGSSDSALPILSGFPRYVRNMELDKLIGKASAGHGLGAKEVVKLFSVRGEEVSDVVLAADELRQQVCGDTVSYVVTRNINYTNICYFKCQFCAFSKGKARENLRGKPYVLALEDIVARAREAWDRGAVEVCLQGGIHPDYTGQTYLDILSAIKRSLPDMHVHAFSPLEIHQGAETLGLSVPDFLRRLIDAGLGSLPGTAAEILHDDVRADLCPDKINTQQWFEVIGAAHELELKTTATIMFGHIDETWHWAEHLLKLRSQQLCSGGFTELVPLPFVHMEAPMYRKGRSRRGPTWRESVLMHAVARLVLHPLFPNIQTSWVKLGQEGIKACLAAGANDIGGTLMNETITRSAGASHGQEMTPQTMEQLLRAIGRPSRQRTTLYGDAANTQQLASFSAPAVVRNDTPGTQSLVKF